jgi:hypothetical protein
VRQGSQRDCDLSRSDLLRVVLDPAGLGKYLIEFLLSDGPNRTFAIKQERARTGCALIEG